MQHPHIVACHEVGEANGLLYFAMEFVTGTDAAKLVRTDGPLAVPRAVRLLLQLLTGLGHAHQRGFVHRDLKPANVLLTEHQSEDFVQLADFGLARCYQESP